MARKDSDNQKKSMSAMFRGRAIFKPLNTGRIDERVACVREWVANIFFYTKNGVTIMIDAGYNYARLQEKMRWLDIDPASIDHILITHQDTDHVGALEEDSERLFQDATVYIGEIENEAPEGDPRPVQAADGQDGQPKGAPAGRRSIPYRRHQDRVHPCSRTYLGTYGLSDR